MVNKDALIASSFFLNKQKYKAGTTARAIDAVTEIDLTSGWLKSRYINNRHTQREFKLKFSALLKSHDFKYTENNKK